MSEPKEYTNQLKATMKRLQLADTPEDEKLFREVLDEYNRLTGRGAKRQQVLQLPICEIGDGLTARQRKVPDIWKYWD